MCSKFCGKMCGKICGKIEKLSDWNKNWCGSRYGPHDYDKETKRQKGKKTKKQKDNKTIREGSFKNKNPYLALRAK